jgi:hypothetical protein
VRMTGRYRWYLASREQGRSLHYRAQLGAALFFVREGAGTHAAYRLLVTYDRTCQAGDNAFLRSIFLRVSSLSAGEDIQTDQVRDENLFFVTETLRVPMYTPELPSVTSRGNLNTAMIPVGAVNRRTRSMVGRLT